MAALLQQVKEGNTFLEQLGLVDYQIVSKTGRSSSLFYDAEVAEMVAAAFKANGEIDQEEYNAIVERAKQLMPESLQSIVESVRTRTFDVPEGRIRFEICDCQASVIPHGHIVDIDGEYAAEQIKTLEQGFSLCAGMAVEGSVTGLQAARLFQQMVEAGIATNEVEFEHLVEQLPDDVREALIATASAMPRVLVIDIFVPEEEVPEEIPQPGWFQRAFQRFTGFVPKEKRN